MNGVVYVFNIDKNSNDILSLKGKIDLGGGIEGVPLLKDINGDGMLEMIVTTLDGYVYALQFLK